VGAGASRRTLTETRRRARPVTGWPTDRMLIWVMLTRLLVVVLGALAACAHTPAVQQPRQKADGELRVMSYNVNYGLPGDKATMEAIASVEPDIVFLQETNDEWKHALVLRFGGTYPHQYFLPPDHEPEHQAWFAGGMGLMSKYPIVSVEKLDSQGGLFFSLRVVLDTNVGKVQVLNVHLHPPMTKSGNYVLGYALTNGRRLHEMENAVAALDPNLPTLIVGDFNEDSSGHAFRYLVNEGYADAVGEFNGKARTWEWPVGPRKLRLQLDHLVHDAMLIPTTGGIVEAGNSDHKPVWADFTRMQPS
jgi:endonuclease/exonuclease/phosphatase family metal-dependent hydrolase